MQVPGVPARKNSATFGQQDVTRPLTGLLLSRDSERAESTKVPGTVPSAGKIFAYALGACRTGPGSALPQRLPHYMEMSGFLTAEPENFTTFVGI